MKRNHHSTEELRNKRSIQERKKAIYNGLVVGFLIGLPFIIYTIFAS